jgi:hypothetical protein
MRDEAQGTRSDREADDVAQPDSGSRLREDDLRLGVVAQDRRKPRRFGRDGTRLDQRVRHLVHEPIGSR